MSAINWKLGKTGYYNLAAIIILMIDSKTIFFYGKFDAPTILIYLSNIEVAIKSVSFLYSLSSCISKNKLV